jgi:hypothetical protein
MVVTFRNFLNSSDRSYQWNHWRNGNTFLKNIFSWRRKVFLLFFTFFLQLILLFLISHQQNLRPLNLFLMTYHHKILWSNLFLNFVFMFLTNSVSFAHVFFKTALLNLKGFNSLRCQNVEIIEIVVANSTSTTLLSFCHSKIAITFKFTCRFHMMFKNLKSILNRWRFPSLRIISEMTINLKFLLRLHSFWRQKGWNIAWNIMTLLK